MTMILGGLSLQQLQAGFRFPGQRLKSGLGSESVESQPLDHQGQWPVTRSLARRLCRNEFPEMKSSETSKVFIRRKKGTYEQTHMGGLRESRVVCSQQFTSLVWGISSGFPLANYLALPGSESVTGLSQGPPMCALHLLAKMEFQRRGLWVG